MRNYDTVIVGGSYSGLSCARSAAARGLNTLVLERKKDLGEKIRTTGIFVGELNSMARRFVPGQTSQLCMRWLIKCISPSKESLDALVLGPMVLGQTLAG